MMFFSGVFSSDSAPYSEVDLPEPVGPVVSTQPYAWVNARRNRVSSCSWKPSLSSSSRMLSLSRMRMTTPSPCTLGIVTTRTSTWRPSIVMRDSPLGDVEIGHDLDPGHDSRNHLLGYGRGLGQDAVDAHPHAHLSG